MLVYCVPQIRALDSHLIVKIKSYNGYNVEGKKKYIFSGPDVVKLL